MHNSDSNKPEHIEELFHYTTINAFLGIVQSKSLWLSDIRFTNDSHEEVWTRNLIRKAAEGVGIERWISKLRAANSTELQLKSFTDRFKIFVNGRMGLEFEIDAGGSDPFVFCLSRAGDSLAQWRGYGNQEVCIGFSYPYLVERFSSDFAGSRFGKVNYFEPDVVSPVVDEMITQMLDLAIEGILNPSRITPDMVLAPTDRFRPFFAKHSGFSSEAEWRVLRRAHGTGLVNSNEYFFRSGGRMPIPTLSIPIDPWVAIKSVRFGPGSDQAMVDNLNRVIKTKTQNLAPNWSISRSTIPYRV